MAENRTYKRGQTIIEAGSAISSLGLIISGRVAAVYPGGAMMLDRADVMGITEVVNEVHFLGYKAVSDTVVVPYPYTNLETLEKLLSQHSDFARVSNRSPAFSVSARSPRSIPATCIRSLAGMLTCTRVSARSFALRLRISVRYPSWTHI